jgi:hypothetical protein
MINTATMTVKEIIEQLSKIPNDKELEIRKVIADKSLQLQLHIIVPLQMVAA